MLRHLALVVLAACTGIADEITLRQTSSTEVTGGAWCSSGANPEATVEASFYRVFELADFGIRGGFRVASFTVGVDEAKKSAGEEYVIADLLVHEYTGAVGGATLDLNAMKLIGTLGLGIRDSPKGTDHRSEFDFTDNVSIDIDERVQVIVVELYTPRVATDDRTFRIGLNALGETGHSYSRCPTVPNLDVPTSYASRGLANAHVVLELTGFEIPAFDRDAHSPL